MTKSRCPAAADQVVERPGEAWFRQVIDWLVQGEEEPRWCQDPEGQARFWAWAEEQALGREEVLQALGVEALAAYRGSKVEALERLTACLASREPVEVEQWTI